MSQERQGLLASGLARQQDCVLRLLSTHEIEMEFYRARESGGVHVLAGGRLTYFPVSRLIEALKERGR